MPQKPKASGSKKAAGKKTKSSPAKSQRERFIEAARAVGVDESGRDFDHAIERIVPPKAAKRGQT